MKTKRTKTKELCKISTADLHKITTTITRNKKNKKKTTQTNRTLMERTEERIVEKKIVDTKKKNHQFMSYGKTEI